jgi:TnpA family transposase
VTRWNQQYLGLNRFPEALSALEIDQYFTPSAEELVAILQRRSDVNAIALGLQLGFLKLTGRLLNSVEIVPSAILIHLGVVIGCAVPQIASIRALYRRRRTLYDHQIYARNLLGRTEIGDHAKRGLTAYLRREAIGVFSVPGLITKAYIWCVEHDYILPRARDVHGAAVLALRHNEALLAKAIYDTTEAELRADWVKRLSRKAPNGDTSVLEWVLAAPLSKSVRALDDQVAKLNCLRDLGGETLALSVISQTGLEHFSRFVATRKASALSRIKEPRRTIELACFIRLQFMRATDCALTLVDHQIAYHWREARKRASISQNGRLARFRGLIGSLSTLVNDDTVSAEDLRARLNALVSPFEAEISNSQIHAVRSELAQKSRELTHLLKVARTIKLNSPKDHQLTKAFAILEQVGSANSVQLPQIVGAPLGRTWQGLISQSDPVEAIKCFRAGTAMLLKRGLKNRSVTAQDSLIYRAPEARLIPKNLWERDHGRYLRNLGLPASAEKYLARIEKQLEAGLGRLADALGAGEASLDAKGVKLPKRLPALKDPIVEDARKSVSIAFGHVQLCDVIVDIDRQIKFSWVLLGRPARHEAELITLYTALFALGSNLSIADLTRMIPTINVEALGQMVARLEAPERMRAANDAVVRFMRQHQVAGLWGSGVDASSDMVSLDATRHLWNARLDPKRKGPAIGTYPHVLDQWSIFYDQPIVLNRRQAGAAIEGALRQTIVDKLERVSVDTHGFSYFGMTLAKFAGFDLCPRLAGLKTRRLYLPKGYKGKLPDVLKPIIAYDRVSPRIIGKGYDGMMRVSASVKDGWYPATDAMEQYGSASRGEAIYETGVCIGKLLRTIYLCDYLGNPAFRNGILDLLNQGEAVHSLQRAIHDGPIAAKWGRTQSQLTAISGALTLLTNIILAWNTSGIQRFIDKNSDKITDTVAAKLAPIGFAHINMRGIMTFDLSTAKTALLTAPDANSGAISQES